MRVRAAGMGRGGGSGTLLAHQFCGMLLSCRKLAQISRRARGGRVLSCSPTFLLFLFLLFEAHPPLLFHISQELFLKPGCKGA